MTVLYVPGTPGTTIYAGRPSPGGTTVTSRMLSNTSGSTQASNFVTPMFGLPLKEGDVPAGQYPEFRLTDNTLVPATVYNMAAWADGSMNMCGVIARVPSSVAGSGSLTVNVKNGGTAPAASSRTLAEVTAGSDIKIEYTGTVNLTGLWTASLNDAIANDANITVIGDGPAGKVWKIGGHFKQAGAPHGQLYCWHYIAVLQDAAGGLLGVRYLGVWGQLFGDVASPAPLARTGTMVLKNVATTVRTMQGLTTRPVPSTEDGTPGTSILMPHFSSASTSGPDAVWDFFQCGGSASTDCTIRVVPATAYVQQAKLVPAYGISASVTDTPSRDYFINGKGNHSEFGMSGPGERDELGVMPAWCAKYWMNPTVLNERAVRVNAMCALSYYADVRPNSSKKPAAGNTTGTFTGIEQKTSWSLSQRTGGIINPASESSVWGTDVAHRPSPMYSAYLMSGEPQILDAMIGHACGHIFLTNGGYSIWKAARPLTGPSMTEFAGERGMRVDNTGETYDCGGVLMRRGGIRQGAWSFRDISQAYAMVPANYTGSDYKGYFQYLLDTAWRGFNEYTAAHPTAYKNDGMFAYGDRQLEGGDGLFMVNYWDMALCFTSQITQRPQIITARQYMGRRFNAVSTRYNVGVFGAYDLLVWDDIDISESYGEVAWVMKNNSGTLTFSTASNNVTLTDGSVGAAWNPTNGDVFAFVGVGTNPATRPYDEMVDYKRFYAVNCSGKTFQLSATPGGSALTVVRNFSTNGNYYIQAQDRVVGFTTGSQAGAGGYLVMSVGCMNYHKLIGDDVSNASTPMQAALAYENPILTGNPKYAFKDTYPA
jgi:hypothetical protein